jgi:hypothetical protein
MKYYYQRSISSSGFLTKCYFFPRISSLISQLRISKDLITIFLHQVFAYSLVVKIKSVPYFFIIKVIFDRENAFLLFNKINSLRQNKPREFIESFKKLLYVRIRKQLNELFSENWIKLNTCKFFQFNKGLLLRHGLSIWAIISHCIISISQCKYPAS